MTDVTSTLIDWGARMRAIAEISGALEDGLPGDSWHLAHAITELAKGTKTIDDVREELGDGWEGL
jgi:hypothetical protein